MSSFARKTAAHAIPKLYSLEPEMKEELIAVLEKLLADRTTLVIGSAVMAFEEVCPDMNELIHKNYRKLVSLLVDLEEWGQIVSQLSTCQCERCLTHSATKRMLFVVFVRRKCWLEFTRDICLTTIREKIPLI